MKKIALFFRIIFKNIWIEVKKPEKSYKSNVERTFNDEVLKWIGKGYKIVDKNDTLQTAILQKDNKINHGMHILLSLLTAGLWMIPYLLILMFRKNNGDTINISVK